MNPFKRLWRSREVNRRLETVRPRLYRAVGRVRVSIMKPLGDRRQLVTPVDPEGFSYAEVTDILAVPVGPVMSRPCRAHNTLNEHLLREFNPSSSTSAPIRFRRIK